MFVISGQTFEERMIISTRGRTCGGRFYKNPDRYVIFINKITEIFNPETEFNDFLAELLAIEFHELGHIYGFRNGCKNHKEKICYWCSFTKYMFIFFRYKDFSIRELNKLSSGV